MAAGADKRGRGRLDACARFSAAIDQDATAARRAPSWHVRAMAARGADDGDDGGRRQSTDFITPEGLQRIQDEIAHLWRVERPQVTRDVSWAAELGDRSENADYIYGKKRLREIDRRLRFLGKRVEALTVVRTRPDPNGKATFGSWVTVEDEDGERARYRLVGPDEFDVSRGWISVRSPMGRALLGKQEGDDVEVVRPRGAASFEIVAVQYTPPDDETTEIGYNPP